MPKKPTRRKGLGVTVEQYDAMLAAQGGGCAICGTKPKTRRLDVDHDHTTGRVRGLLCHRCNRALPGWVTSDWLADAARYIEPGGAARRWEKSIRRFNEKVGACGKTPNQIAVGFVDAAGKMAGGETEAETLARAFLAVAEAWRRFDQNELDRLLLTGEREDGFSSLNGIDEQVWVD